MFWNEVERSYRWEPLRQLQQLQDEMNQLLGATFNGLESTGNYPPVNVWSGKEKVVLTAELPGMSPEDIDISVLGNTLTISGTRRGEPVGDGIAVHRRERGAGEFVRTVELPVRVDPNRVEASYERGILQVALPRAEEDKPKQVKIKLS